MSAPYLPSKTLHSKDPSPPKCPSNTILKNIHAVSICDLLTVDTVLAVGCGVGIGCGIGKVFGVHNEITKIIIMIVSIVTVLVLWITLHVYLDIPSNLNYYFGFGKPPHVFKTCACFPVPSTTDLPSKENYEEGSYIAGTFVEDFGDPMRLGRVSIDGEKLEGFDNRISIGRVSI